MASDRLKQLEQFYREDPGDPFNIYALALEYQQSDPARTRALFNILLTEHPDYMPTYYHAAKLFQDVGETNKAIEVYERGMELARKMNDQKTLRELRSAYDEMMFE